MKMQYIVIEGRKPQDGSKPTQATFILPEWVSPTLACAGIVGRIIELTDGNIIEQGKLNSADEAELRAELRAEVEEAAELANDLQGLQVTEADIAAVRAEAMEPVSPLPADEAEPNALDSAYREGMQATRDKLAGLLLQFGMPTDAKVPNWLKEELEELAAFRESRPETLAKLQAAEDNLDAWRDAAGAAGLGQECDEKSGQVKRLFVVPGIPARDTVDDVRILQETIDGLETANGHMREELRNMHSQLMQQPTVMNFAGPVTIVQGNPPSVFGPDLSKSAE